MINFTKALSVFATMLAFTNADPIREPARLRLNADLIKTVFHSGDQRILDIFSDLEWEEPDGLLQNFIGSITTVDGIDPENYDFEIFLNDPEKKFIGFEGKNLRFVGKAKYDGVEYSFQAPVKEFRLEMEMIHDPDKEIAKINKDAMMPTAKQFSFDLDDVAVEGGADKALRQLFKDESEKAVLTAYEDIWEGDFETMSKLPLESFLPMLLLKQISSVAKTFEIAPNYLEYGFDPEIFYAKDRPFFKKKRSMLKEIDSEFTEQKEGDDPFAFQIILDENVVNAFLLDFVLYEKAFSLRQIMKLEDRTRPFLEQLNTTNIGLLMQSVIDEFGADKEVDFYISLSHSLISKKIENAKVSGFQIDKNGNFRFQFNFSVTILVEDDKGGFQEARSMFVGLTAKGKFLIVEQAGERVLQITPKGAEVSNLKIYDQHDKEMVAEEMMFTAGLNVQLESFINLIPPKEIPLRNPPSPKELECLGFKLGNMDLNFKKGYMEVNFGYKKVKYPSNPKVCEKFLEYIRRGPQEFLKGAREVMDMRNDPNFKHDPESIKERLAEKLNDLSEKVVRDLPDRENTPEEMQVEL